MGIADIIAVLQARPVFAGKFMRMIPEIESLQVQGSSAADDTSGILQEISEDFTVLPQNPVDAADEIVEVSILFVVECAAAFVAAKFFVGSSLDRFSTGQAASRSRFHL